MNSILLLVSCGIFLQHFAAARFHLNSDNVFVGVSQLNLENYITKAVNGFKNIIINGDDELDYPIMDPCKIENISWEHIDTSKDKKYRLNLSSKNTTVIKGFSSYTINRIKVDAKDLKIMLTLSFKNLQTEFPYKLEGHFLKNVLPIYGDGIIKTSGNNQGLQIDISLNNENGTVNVGNAYGFRYYDDINIKITGLMDLPDPFASILMDDILDDVVREYSGRALRIFIRNLVEKTVGGMTIEEFFEYLDYFVKKNE